MTPAEGPVSEEARAGELLAADFLAAVHLDTGMLADLCNAAYETTPRGELLWAMISLAGVLKHETERSLTPGRLEQIVDGLRRER